jgi:hypothetical protein
VAKTSRTPGRAKKHKDRGGVKPQPRPSGTRLKRGDDDLLAGHSKKAVRRKDRGGGVKQQPRPKQSGVKRGEDDLLAAYYAGAGKKTTSARKTGSRRRKSATKKKAV